MFIPFLEGGVSSFVFFWGSFSLLELGAICWLLLVAHVNEQLICGLKYAILGVLCITSFIISHLNAV